MTKDYVTHIIKERKEWRKEEKSMVKVIAPDVDEQSQWIQRRCQLQVLHFPVLHSVYL